jgi:hypothetical protein
MKSIFKSKTFWFNTVATVGSIVSVFTPVMPVTALPYITAGIGAVNVLLRTVTKDKVTIK